MIHNFKKLYTPDEQNRLFTYFNTISEKEQLRTAMKGSFQFIQMNFK